MFLPNIYSNWEEGETNQNTGRWKAYLISAQNFRHSSPVFLALLLSNPNRSLRLCLVTSWTQEPAAIFKHLAGQTESAISTQHLNSCGDHKDKRLTPYKLWTTLGITSGLLTGTNIQKRWIGKKNHDKLSPEFLWLEKRKLWKDYGASMIFISPDSNVIKSQTN